MSAGKVYAVAFHSGAAATVTTVATALAEPVGVDFRDKALYVSASDRILRFDDIAQRLDNPPAAVVVSDRFPGSAQHDTGTPFPAQYRNQVFIAEHGSWNRSKTIGYRVTLVRVANNRALSYEPFATGWLQNETTWGRPADALVAPDGSLLVADDDAGAIYRISCRAPG